MSETHKCFGDACDDLQTDSRVIADQRRFATCFLLALIPAYRSLVSSGICWDYFMSPRRPPPPCPDMTSPILHRDLFIILMEFFLVCRAKKRMLHSSHHSCFPVAEGLCAMKTQGAVSSFFLQKIMLQVIFLLEVPLHFSSHVAR